MRRLYVMAACLVVVLIAGCTSGSDTRNLSGTLLLFGDRAQTVNAAGTPVATDRPQTPCVGAGVDADVRAGNPVVVRDEAGAELARGSLDQGRLNQDGTCEFRFTVEDVPDAPFYRIAVGDETERGVPYAREQLDEADWKIFLSAGT